MIRIGHGTDIHRLEKERKLIIGGVDIPYEKGLWGHSDADVLLHALIDALLGAAALGDIGRLFPDTDPQYQNADSRILLKSAYRKLQEKHWEVINIDATLHAERPKMMTHIPKMISNIATTLDLLESQINIKAKTGEKLGFVGREEGIACEAVVLIQTLQIS